MQEDSVRKSVLHYAKCSQGNMHAGELLNLVCVDAACKNRGLICPVCRMQYHQNHQILPVKVFIDQIRQIFLNTGESQDLSTLTDFLKSLQNSRKNLMNTLKDTAKKLAQHFENLQTQINTNYSSLRKSILTQSTISTKLPNLVNLLMDASDKNPDQLQKQFQKYVQLLKYQNQKVKVSDKSKKVVEQYAKVPIKLSKYLNEKTKTIQQILTQLPLTLNQQQVKKSSTNSYTFSTLNKSNYINISADGKTATSNFDNYDGKVVFVNEGRGELDQKITLNIVKNSSDMIHVGMGIVEQFKVGAFQYDYLNKFKTHQMVASSGLPQNLGGSESSSVLQDIGFTFNENQTIEITYNGNTNLLTFKILIEDNSEEEIDRKKQWIISLHHTLQQKMKLQFVIGLGADDSVTIG